MAKDIELIIDEDGTIHMEALNFHGKGCHEALEIYRKACGKLKAAKRKADFYHVKVGVGVKVKK